jgi:hypothetical protein
MIPAAELEDQIGHYFDGFILPPGDVATVIDSLEPTTPERDPDTTRRLRLWQRLHAGGEIDDKEYARPVERIGATAPAGPPPLDLAAAADLLTDVHRLWDETDATGRRALATTTLQVGHGRSTPGDRAGACPRVCRVVHD